MQVIEYDDCTKGLVIVNPDRKIVVSCHYMQQRRSSSLITLLTIFPDDELASLEDSHHICACCDFQYGYSEFFRCVYEDKTLAYREWRERWMADGMKWQSSALNNKFCNNTSSSLEPVLL